MSLSFLRDNIITAIQERADAASTRAMNNHPAGHQSADTYAMTSIDALSEARALLTAIAIVRNEYSRLVEPERAAKDDAEVQDKKPMEPIY